MASSLHSAASENRTVARASEGDDLRRKTRRQALVNCRRRASLQCGHDAPQGGGIGRARGAGALVLSDGKRELRPFDKGEFDALLDTAADGHTYLRPRQG